MNQNKRIFLNVVATYGRSLYTLVLGLLCGRWLLQSLGKVDYGLVGLVGGLTAFVSFFNSILSSAVGRFYAVNVGAATKADNEVSGIEENRKWFNTALAIHTTIPFVLVTIGYPIGHWAVCNFLTIPADRIVACVWAWRFACLTCFFSMVEVPFSAMFTAKQEIAELTVYSVLRATLNALLLYYMIKHPGDWMMRYCAWNCLLAAVPQFCVVFRAFVKYPECRFRLQYCWSPERFRQILHYAFARFWANFATFVNSQGHSILVNKYMGPAYNASMTVGNRLSSHALTLSTSLSGAFWPAIANAAGAGNFDEVKRLSYMTCRIGSILVLVFALPLSLESKKVLELWLVNPPDFAWIIAISVMFRAVLERMTEGYWMAILGQGKGVMRYSWTIGWHGVLSVAVAWTAFSCHLGMWSIVIAHVISKFFVTAVRLYWGRVLVQFSFSEWVRRIMVPMTVLSSVSLVGGWLPRLFMAPSLLRIVVSSLICEAIFIPSVYLLVLEKTEREYLTKKIGKFFHRS